MEAVLTRKETDILESYWELLSVLNRKIKLGLAARLTDAVLQEEINPSNRVAPRRVVRRPANIETDEQLEQRFAGKDMPDLPDGDSSWQDIIKANSGRTIKPIEKWL